MQALILVLVFCLIGVGVFVYSGAFNVAADVPDNRLTRRLLETLRERSIAVRIGNIQVPRLEDPKMIAEGAEHYAEMCTSCHLAPGMTESEIRPGLNPLPPRLIEPQSLAPARAFWVIKHGIWLTAMPAWGTTHDDTAIWNIVAFLQKLPTMKADEYQRLTEVGEREHDHEDHAHKH
jgi:hypothetical protein